MNYDCVILKLLLEVAPIVRKALLSKDHDWTIRSKAKSTVVVAIVVPIVVVVGIVVVVRIVVVRIVVVVVQE